MNWCRLDSSCCRWSNQYGRVLGFQWTAPNFCSFLRKVRMHRQHLGFGALLHASLTAEMVYVDEEGLQRCLKFYRWHLCVCVRRVIRGMLIELFAQLRGTQWWNMLALSFILCHHYCLCVRVLVFCAHIFCGHPVPILRIILNWKCWITDVTFPGALQELLSVWCVFHLLCYWSAPPVFVERLSALGEKKQM